ncbi:MAG TPA: DUF6599 family protein [candidate division Zixibacteria bacterium]
MKRNSIIILVLLSCSLVSNIAFGLESLTLLFPTPEDGWVNSETAKTYNRQNIFDYIDGGAELYLAYDFQQVAVQKYIPTNQDSVEEKSITVEIWQMNSPEDAYGVFSFDQEGEKVPIGQMGVYDAGYLRFWKNVYVVRILQMLESSKETILQLGRGIDQQIQKESKLPLLVQQVPPDSLLSASVCFFHQQIIFNNLFPISDQDKLNLNAETDGVLAEFRVCDDNLKLLLIRYPDTARAVAVERNLKEPYLTKGGSASDKIFMSNEKGLLGMEVSGNHLILVFNGKDKQNVFWLLAKVVSSLEGRETKAEPRCFRYR